MALCQAARLALQTSLNMTEAQGLTAGACLEQRMSRPARELVRAPPRPRDVYEQHNSLGDRCEAACAKSEGAQSRFGRFRYHGYGGVLLRTFAECQWSLRVSSGVAVTGRSPG